MISHNIFNCDNSEFNLLFSLYNSIRLTSLKDENEKIRQFKFEYIISDYIMIEIEEQLNIQFLVVEINTKKI